MLTSRNLTHAKRLNVSKTDFSTRNGAFRPHAVRIGPGQRNICGIVGVYKSDFDTLLPPRCVKNGLLDTRPRQNESWRMTHQGQISQHRGASTGAPPKKAIPAACARSPRSRTQAEARINDLSRALFKPISCEIAICTAHKRKRVLSSGRFLRKGGTVMAQTAAQNTTLTIKRLKRGFRSLSF